MKKLAIATILSVSLALIAGCATSTGKSAAQVKCPACGYNFAPHQSPGN